MKNPVKYLGIIIGYSCDGQSIEFLDNEEAQIIKNELLNGRSIGVSSRRTGTIEENGRINYTDITEYGIINHFDTLIDSKHI